MTGTKPTLAGFIVRLTVAAVFVGFYLVLITSLGGCNYNRVNQAADPAAAAKLELDALGFREVEANILGPRCLGCHTPETGSKGGSNLESYAQVRAQLTRVAFRALEAKDMPPGQPLSDDEQKALAAWIDQGAPEIAPRTAGPRSRKLEGPADFTQLSENLFTPKCLSCHNSQKSSGGLDLSNYELVTAKASQLFNRLIIKQDMPVAPLPGLTPAEKRLLLKWFELGMPR